MHAFRANGNGPIEFWRVSARAASYTPPLNKYSCLQDSGSGLTDVLNYYNYCTSHTWDLHYNNGSPQEYQQTDTIDGSNFLPLTASADVDTADFNFGQPPTWNNHTGYDVDPNQVGTGIDWDKASTRTAIVAALNAVNFTALWAGSLTENGNFQYDRYDIPGATQGQLPVGGTLPAGGTGSGMLLAYPGGYGPDLALSGAVGDLTNFGHSGNGNSSSDGVLGVGLSRTQIQIRNFRGAPIPYFIYESAEVADSVFHTIPNSTLLPGLANTKTFYRKVSEGNWTANRQIIQLPDAAMDGPQTITAPIGTAVRCGTLVSMVVGMTWEDWMFSILGASWADYVFA